jgi:hypothetical protein
MEGERKPAFPPQAGGTPVLASEGVQRCGGPRGPCVRARQCWRRGRCRWGRTGMERLAFGLNVLVLWIV